MKTVGFIGCGNMGGAIMGGIISRGYVDGAHVIASDRNEAQLKHAADTMGICTTTDNREAAEKADILFLSVKPQFYESNSGNT